MNPVNWTLSKILPARPVPARSIGRFGLVSTLVGAALCVPAAYEIFQQPELPVRVAQVQKYERELASVTSRELATNPETRKTFEQYSQIVRDPATHEAERTYTSLVTKYQPNFLESCLAGIGISLFVTGSIFSLNLLQRNSD